MIVPAGIVLSACSEEVYDSSLYDNGTVTVTVNAPEDVHECIVLVPETDTVEVENGRREGCRDIGMYPASG